LHDRPGGQAHHGAAPGRSVGAERGMALSRGRGARPGTS
jgi:hypothetical protein